MQPKPIPDTFHAYFPVILSSYNISRNTEIKKNVFINNTAQSNRKLC